MWVDAFLCDAATVREGLLHVLGGGITILWRDRYPANMDTAVALLLKVESSELADHKVDIKVQGEDGQRVAAMTAQMSLNPDAVPPGGEAQVVPLAIGLHRVPLPQPGRYAIDVLVDGHMKSRLDFRAAMSSERPSRR